MGKRLKDGIYAKSCNGSTDQLLFRKAMIDGRLYIAYIKNNVVVALKDWNEVSKEMYMPGPYLQIKKIGSTYCIADR